MSYLNGYDEYINSLSWVHKCKTAQSTLDIHTKRCIQIIATTLAGIVTSFRAYIKHFLAQKYTELNHNNNIII